MDANKNKPGGLFGNTGGNNIFGTATSKPSDQPGGFFGASNAFNASVTASSTTPQSSPAKPSPFSSNLFGNSASGSPSINFGANSTSAASSAPKVNIFGGSNSNPTTTTASSNTPSLFGNSTTKGGTTGPTVSFNPGMFGVKPSNPESSSTTSSSNPASGSQPGGLFGATPSKTGTTNLFGNTTAGSGSPAPNATNLTFSFGASSTNQPAKDTSNTKSLFGGGDASKSSAVSSPPLFGFKPSDQSNSNNSGGPASTTNPTPTFQSTPSTSSSGSPSLFAPVTSSKTTTSHELPAKPASSPFSVPSSGGGLAIKSTAPAKSSPLATNSSIPGEGSQSTQPSTSKAAGTPPATPSSKPNINLAPSLLKGKTLEDLVSRWNSELDERVEDFKHTANEIAAWDQVLIQNGDQISVLYDELQRIEPIQSSIDQTLDFVEAQQQELLTALEEYERQLSSHQAQDFATTTGGRTRTAAQEREEAYKTAEEVHVQLNDMAASLGTMIAELNSLAGPGNRIDESSTSLDGGSTISSTTSSNEDPIVQIAGILNAHLGSLNWISEITQELGSKVNELESRISNTKVEFGLESNPNGSNGTTNLTRQLVDFNSHDDFNPPASLSAGGVAASLGHHHHPTNFGNRISSNLLSHPRR